MHPELFKIGSFAVKAYGLTLAVSFFLGTMLAVRRARKSGLNPLQMLDLCFIVMVAAIIGSRLFYVVYHFDEFKGHLIDIINPFQRSGEVGIAGLSMMGGLVLAIAAALAYFIIKKINPWPLLDALAPSFFLGKAVTRIGCFLNGCCFGHPTHCGCGVVFPADSMAGWTFPDTPLWPTQLMSSAAGLIMFVALLVLEKRKRYDGFTFWNGLTMYSVWRFTIDFFRYYEDSMVFMKVGGIAISRNQFLCLCLLAISIWWHLYLRKKHVRPKPIAGKNNQPADR